MLDGNGGKSFSEASEAENWNLARLDSSTEPNDFREATPNVSSTSNGLTANELGNGIHPIFVAH